MPPKKIAVGAKTTVLMDIEESFGTPPTVHGGVQLPVNTFSLKPSRAKNTAATLTGQYDPTEPFDGNLEVSGAVTVPVDARAFGHWLKAMFGTPATTGDAAPYTHVWKSGADMPSLMLQASYGPVFGQFTGCKVASMSLQAGGDGELTASVNLNAREADYVDTSYNDTPTIIALKRFSNFQGSLLSAGQPLAVVTDFSLDINFGLDTSIRAIGDQGRVYDLVQAIMAVTGSITVFFTDKSLLLKAKNSEDFSLNLGFAINADTKLTFSLPEVQLSFDGPTVDGPTGIKMQHNIVAYFNDNVDKASVVTTLVNDVATY